MHAQKQVSVSLRCIEFYFILFQAINAKKSIFTHLTNSDLHTMPIHCQTVVLECRCEQPSLIVTSIKTRDVYINIYYRFRQLSIASVMYHSASFEFRISQFNHHVSIMQPTTCTSIQNLKKTSKLFLNALYVPSPFTQNLSHLWQSS